MSDIEPICHEHTYAQWSNKKLSTQAMYNKKWMGKIWTYITSKCGIEQNETKIRQNAWSVEVNTTEMNSKTCGYNGGE